MKLQTTWARRLWAVLVAALILAAAGRAEAHAIVIRTDPPDGAELAQAPRQIRIWLNELVSPNLTHIQLVDSSGKSTPVTFIEDMAGAPLGPTQDALLIVNLPPLPPGAYRLTWQAVSNSDLHATGGTVVFGVQTPAQAAAPVTERAPSASEVLFHWFDLACFALLTGAMALAARLILLPRPGLPPNLIEQAWRRLVHLAVWASVVGVLGGIALLAVQKVELGTGWGDILLATRYGQFWLVREAVLAIVAFALIALPKHRRRGWLAVVGLGIATLAVTEILSTHISDLYGYSWLRLLAGTVHLLSAGLWAGGVAALAVSCWPLLRRGPLERAVAQNLLRGFGWLALASVGVLGVTGLFLSGQMVATADAWLRTLYGQTLLIKIGFVLLTGLVGLLNSASLHETLARWLGRLLRQPAGWTPFGLGRLRQTLLLEAGLAVCVLVLTSVLGAAQPALGPQWDSSTAGVAPDAATSRLEDLQVTLAVKPDRPGQNFVTVDVFNTRRPAPAPIDKVLVRFARPESNGAWLTAVADALGDGHYQVNGGMIDTSGEWQIEVVVQRPGLPDGTLAVNWNVLPPSSLVSSQPVLVSNAPLAPVMNLAALGLALLLALAGCAVWGAYRWRVRHQPRHASAASGRG